MPTAVQDDEGLLFLASFEFAPPFGECVVFPFAALLLCNMPLCLPLRRQRRVFGSLHNARRPALPTNAKNVLPDAAVDLGELGRADLSLDELLKFDCSGLQLI